MELLFETIFPILQHPPTQIKNCNIVFSPLSFIRQCFNLCFGTVRENYPAIVMLCWLMFCLAVVLTDPSIESQVLDSDSESDSEAGSVPEGLTATMKLDDWLVFRLDNEAASLVYQLRLKWHTLLLRRLKNANKSWTPVSLAGILTC